MGHQQPGRTRRQPGLLAEAAGAGTGDRAAASLPVPKADPSIESARAPANSYVFLGFRMLKAPFTDQRFRRAVYMSLNWDAAIKTLVPPELGSRAYGTVPPGLL